MFFLQIQKNEVKPQWIGSEGIANFENVRVNKGEIKTMEINNKDGISFCKFTLDASFEIQHGKKIFHNTYRISLKFYLLPQYQYIGIE